MRAAQVITAVLVATLIGGCGASPQAGGQDTEPSVGTSTTAPVTSDPVTPGETGVPPAGATTLPTELGPPTVDGPRPPRTPSDLVPSYILVGTIRGGGGSCYTLETDDGVRYALVDVYGHVLAPGEVVKVTIAEDRPAVAPCPGRPVTVVELEVV